MNVTTCVVSLRSWRVLSSRTAGPSTAATPGSALTRCWKASSACSRAVVVIGPGVWKSTSKGAAKPAPRSLWKRSKLTRAGLLGGRLARFGGPVLSPIAGAASSSSGSATKKAAAPGLLSARSAIATHGLAPRAPPNCQRLTFVPSTISSDGIIVSATTTATIVATSSPSEEDTSSAPGASASAVSIPIASAEPANSTVRPARAVTSSTASGTLRPFASSSRNRDTTSRE